MAKNTNEIPGFEEMARRLLADAVTYAEVTGINFFKDSFNKQGWTGASFEPWTPRKNGNDGRGILIKSGNLRDSLRVLMSSPLRIEFGTSAPYSKIHNEGGVFTVRVTPRSRKFFWFMFRATGQGMWKGMALTKKQALQIRMPRRQFIGESPALMGQLDQWLTGEINNRFSKL